MKELELNLENLFNLGLTPEILKSDFENWVIENNDIIIDFDNQIIYYDVIKHKKDLDYLLEATKNELINIGRSKEDIELFIENERKDAKEKFYKILNELPAESKHEFILHSIPKFRDQFLEYKKQYFDGKYLELLNPGILNAISRNPIANPIISEYKKAIPSAHFTDCLNRLEDDGSPNIFYYGTVISNWLKQRNDQLSKNESLSERFDLLTTYNKLLYNLMMSTVGLFKQINKDDNTQQMQNLIINEINIHAGDRIATNLKSIGNHSSVIKHNIIANDFEIAIKIQDYCSFMLEDAIKLLKNQLLINVLDSPLADKFQNAKSELENAVDLERIKLLKELSVANKPVAPAPKAESKKKYTVNGLAEIHKIAQASNENPYTRNGLVEISNLINSSTSESYASLQSDENTNLHERIIEIINHPAKVLMDIADDYIGKDVDGNELFVDNIEDFNYDYENEIVNIFKDINHLTTKLMENKAQSVVDGYLNIIFKELMEIMPIVVDYWQDTVYKQKDYPKKRAMYFYNYYNSLGKYYEFLIEFVKEETFSKYNKIIIDDISYFTIKGESAIQDNTVVNSTNKSPKVINIEFSDKLDNITDEENPYPKIFNNHKAYTIFKNLLDEFGNTKENLSNYSFIFHKMTYEDLIHNDLKQKSYFDFLGVFDISINRIKPLGEIGKMAYRESIYLKAKS